MKYLFGRAARGALLALGAALLVQLPQPAVADSGVLEQMRQVLLGHATHPAAASLSRATAADALTDDAQALARRTLAGSPSTERSSVRGHVGPSAARGADEGARAQYLAHDDAQSWARRALLGHAPTGS